MKQMIAHHLLRAFIVMALLCSWIAVLPLILNPALLVEPFQMLGAFAGPTLAAIIVIAVTEGRARLAAFFHQYVQWRAGLAGGCSCCFPYFACAYRGCHRHSGSIGVGFLRHQYRPDFAGLSPHPGRRRPARPTLGGARLARVRLAAPASALRPSHWLRHPGGIWALWHLPGYFGGWMSSSFPALLLYCIGSILATWVYNSTRGSLLLMILLHSSSNAARGRQRRAD